MKRYKDWSPTDLDIAGLNAETLDIGEWYVAPCILTRDSKALETSNFAACVRLCTEGDCNNDNWQRHSFGHWACGFFEVLLVRPDSAAYKAMERAEERLEDYCALDEDDWSNREHETVCEVWDSMSMRERIRMCVERRESVFAARRDSPPDRVYDRLRDST